MKKESNYRGAVVPMVTPFTTAGGLDEAAADRLVDSLLAGGVEGIFVLGTTGEGARVPVPSRMRLVERAAARAKNRALIYCGLGDVQPANVPQVNDYFRAGADVLVAHPPISNPLASDQLAGWYRALMDRLEGPFLIYNIPSTTKTSIPLNVLGELAGHPRLVGLKDSENDPRRLEELLRRFVGTGLSVFIGVGVFMLRGMQLGAAGIVPSVGNLAPRACQEMCNAARLGDWDAAARHYAVMTSASKLYQDGRSLNESLSALKAAVHCLGLCESAVLPPLVPFAADEINVMRGRISQLQLNGK